MSKQMAFRRRGTRLVLVVIFATTACVVAAVWFQEAPLRRAERLLGEGKAAEALQAVEEWERTHGAQGKSHAIRARCFVRLGRYREATALFEQFGAETTEEMHAWARAWLHLRQWAHALPLLEEVNRRDPDNPDVLHELTSCRAKLGRLDEALQSARQFAKHKQYAHRAWLLIGMLLREQGNKEQAAEAWSRVQQFDPDLDDLQVPADEFLTQFAGLQLQLGKPSQAADLLRAALSAKETAEAHYQMGVAQEELGRLEAARRHWERAQRLDPDHRAAREALARLAIGEGDGERAEDLLKPLLQAGRLTSSTTYLMQRAAYLKGDRSGAEKWREKTEALRTKETLDATLDQLLRERPGSYWAQVIRCYRFAQRKNWQQAEAMLETIPATDDEHEFVAKLRKAVARHGPLPPAELLPISSF